jgi:hypothetical protein
MIHALPIVLVAAVTGMVHLEDDVPAGGGDYLLVDFDVPTGTQESRLTHTDGSADNILDGGVFAPEGFRGYGGGLEDDATIGALASSRGYLTGPLTPGTWRLLIGLAKINAPPGHYSVDVFFHDAPTLAPQALGDPTPPTLETGARWYAGDLHVHSEQSGDAGATFQEIYDLARSLGLDFVVLSDHNTVAQHRLVPAFQATVSDLLFVRGAEITTYGGHAGGVGISEIVDWRVGLGGLTIDDVVADVAGQGGFFVVNHPALDIGDACIGCGWSYDGAFWGQVGGIEIQTGQFDVTGAIFTPRAIELWEAQQAAGRHLVAVGGSDDHQAGEDTGAFAGRIGSPTTLVYADSLSEPALVAAMQAGRVVVKLRGTDDPMVELFARGDTGAEVATGGSLGPVSRVTLRAHVTGGAGAAVVITRNGEFVEQRDVDSDDFETTFGYPVTRLEGDRFRASVYADGADVTIGNYIYVTALNPDAEPDGCGCRASGRRAHAGAALWLLLVALCGGYSRTFALIGTRKATGSG